MVATRLEATYNPAIAFLPQLGLAAVLLLGGESVIHSNLSLGQFTAFYLYLNMLITPMRSLGVMLNLAQRATASGARLFQVLDRAPRLTAAPGAPPLPPGNGHVQLRDVTLRYDESDEFGAAYSATAEVSPGTGANVGASNGAAAARRTEPRIPTVRAVLRDIDLDVPAGRTVALVGADRLGQDEPGVAHLAAVRPELRDRAAGRRRRAHRGPALAAPRRRDRQRRPVPVLGDSRGEHRLCQPRGRPGQIEAAARRAQAHEFIEGLPAGYDTRVGERGLTLSGGQRQRIAIARALLADPRVLILDDATSSVDASTERRSSLRSREAMQGRTTFVVAHRLSTIALADEIVVLDHGRITARGDHAELLERSELYREIVEKGLPEPSAVLMPEAREPEVSGI